jgi:hypothetical protein
MKKFTSTLLFLLSYSVLAFAQIAPNGLNYQAVARDATGNTLVS